MKGARAIFCAAFALASAAAWSVETRPRAVVAQAEHRQLARELFHQGFFRTASCRELSDYVLSRAGLPKLRHDGSVAGLRLDTDRRREGAEPPEFADGVAGEDGRSVQLVAAGDRRHWTLTVSRAQRVPEGARREKKTLRFESRFRFAIVETKNIGSCELVDLSFHAEEADTSKRFERVFTPDECLDLYLQGAPAESRLPALAVATLRQLRADCSLGARFSKVRGAF